MSDAFVAGFELGEVYSQICCRGDGMNEPVSISLVEGSEKYRIPTDDPEKFLKKAMRLMKPYGKLHEAAAVVFAVERADGENASKVRKTAMQIMGVPESRIFVISREEAFCGYVVNQPREIWRHQALLFTFAGECLQAHALSINAGTSPMTARIDHEDGWSIPASGMAPDEKDRIFTELARSILSERPVSSIFLVGDGFEERWYDGTLRLLCQSGRRVFAGNNIYAKGACYRAVSEAAGVKNCIYLGSDKIFYNVGLKTPGSGKKAVYSLLEAGTSWYEAKAEVEALLCDEPVVEFILVPMQGNELMKESLYLDGLPKRPPRTSRLRISASFTDVDRLRVSVADLGFGELFPSSDLIWTEEIELGSAT